MTQMINSAKKYCKSASCDKCANLQSLINKVDKEKAIGLQKIVYELGYPSKINTYKHHIIRLEKEKLISTIIDGTNQSRKLYYKPEISYDISKELLLIQHLIFSKTGGLNYQFPIISEKQNLINLIQDININYLRLNDIFDYNIYGEIRGNYFLTSSYDHSIKNMGSENKILLFRDTPARDFIIKSRRCRHCFRELNSNSFIAESYIIFAKMDNKSKDIDCFTRARINLNLHDENYYFDEISSDLLIFKFLNGYYHNKCHNWKSKEYHIDYTHKGEIDGGYIINNQICHVNEMTQTISDNYGLDSKQISEQMMAVRPYFQCTKCSLPINPIHILLSAGIDNDSIDNIYVKLDKLRSSNIFNSLFCGIYTYQKPVKDQNSEQYFQETVMTIVKSASVCYSQDKKDEFSHIQLVHPWCREIGRGGDY